MSWPKAKAVQCKNSLFSNNTRDTDHLHEKQKFGPFLHIMNKLSKNKTPLLPSDLHTHARVPLCVTHMQAHTHGT